MRTAKAVLALFVSASLAMPASGQVRAAASVAAGSALSRVSLPGASAPSAVVLAPPLLALTPIAPPFAPSPTGAFPASSASAARPSALPAVSAAESVPAAESSEEPPVQAAAEFLPAGGVPASAPEKKTPAPDASARTRWENFWSGAPSRRASGIDSGASAVPVARTSPSVSPLTRSAAARAGAAAMLIVPAPHEVPAFFARAAPFMEAGGILLGAYVVSRVIHPLTGRLAVKMGLDAQNLPTFRLGTNVAVWIAAASAALVVGGASHTTLTAVFGAGGTILSFALGDILGNVIQGLNFLITRPFTVGARVQIGDETGTVTDVTLTNIVLKMDDGSPGRMRHAALADVPVIVSGTYVAAADAKFRLSVPAKPKFHGAFGAIVKSLDRRFWFAAAAFAALLAFPALVPFAAAGWAATAVHWSLAGVIVWLTRRLDMTLRAAVDQLSRANGWRTETTVITHLAVSALLWAFGGGAALRLFGLSWMTLIASLGLTTFVVGLASKKFFGSVFKVLFAKPVKIGDRVRLKTISGLVVGMTLSHVVLRLDDERYELVPYAVVDAALVNNPLAVTSGK